MHTSRLSATVKQMKTRPRATTRKSRPKTSRRSPAKPLVGRMKRDYELRPLLKKWRDYCDQTGVRSTNVLTMTFSRTDRWNIHLQALTQYANRTGTALVPTTHIEQVGGRNIALGAWVAYNRQQKRQGRLARERVEQLSAFAGWEWDKQKPGKHDNPERDARIASEYREGTSARDLANKYKLSRQRVHQIVKRTKVA